jgi:RNA polymerase sigma-70 factor (ECF subfamily)
MPGASEIDPELEALLFEAGQGNRQAVEHILGRYRGRLREMVALRLDRRLLGRFDPSDVVQDALMDASRKLPDYLKRRPLPLYPWLRQLALERLIDLHRQHVKTKKRSVSREEPLEIGSLPDESAALLAHRVAASGTNPSTRLIQKELRERVQAALDELSPRDRELLVMLYLEQLSIREVAQSLDITEKAVVMRHLRALERLQKHLRDLVEE